MNHTQTTHRQISREVGPDNVTKACLFVSLFVSQLLFSTATEYNHATPGLEERPPYPDEPRKETHGRSNGLPNGLPAKKEKKTWRSGEGGDQARRRNCAR